MVPFPQAQAEKAELEGPPVPTPTRESVWHNRQEGSQKPRGTPSEALSISQTLQPKRVHRTAGLTSGSRAVKGTKRQAKWWQEEATTLVQTAAQAPQPTAVPGAVLAGRQPGA